MARWSRLKPDDPSPIVSRIRILAAQGRLADAVRQAEAARAAGLDERRSGVAELGIRRSLRDMQWLESSAMPRAKAFAALFKGEKDQAFEIISADPSARVSVIRGIGAYAFIGVSAGRAADVARYYDTEVKTPAAAVDALPYCACSATPLLLALKTEGHADFPALLARVKARQDQDRALRGATAPFVVAEADIAGLEGDVARARALYARAMDLGWRDPAFVDPAFHSFLPAGAETDALSARMKALIDAERRALGMAPI